MENSSLWGKWTGNFVFCILTATKIRSLLYNLFYMILHCRKVEIHQIKHTNVYFQDCEILNNERKSFCGIFVICTLNASNVYLWARLIWNQWAQRCEIFRFSWDAWLKLCWIIKIQISNEWNEKEIFRNLDFSETIKGKNFKFDLKIIAWA